MQTDVEQCCGRCIIATCKLFKNVGGKVIQRRFVRVV